MNTPQRDPSLLEVAKEVPLPYVGDLLTAIVVAGFSLIFLSASSLTAFFIVGAVVGGLMWLKLSWFLARTPQAREVYADTMKKNRAGIPIIAAASVFGAAWSSWARTPDRALDLFLIVAAVAFLVAFVLITTTATVSKWRSYDSGRFYSSAGVMAIFALVFAAGLSIVGAWMGRAYGVGQGGVFFDLVPRAAGLFVLGLLGHRAYFLVHLKTISKDLDKAIRLKLHDELNLPPTEANLKAAREEGFKSGLFLPAIRHYAEKYGADPELAIAVLSAGGGVSKFRLDFLGLFFAGPLLVCAVPFLWAATSALAQMGMEMPARKAPESARIIK